MPSAQDIMTTDPACVTPQTTVSDAARIMKEKHVGMLPVVEAAGSDRLVGVVTDRDITIRHVAEGHDNPGCPVREAMSTDIATCSPKDDIKDVMKAMATEQVRRIPIVDERGSLVGVVAQADVAMEADDDDAGKTVEKISEPHGRHAG
jgi:CBS domain-containing protein